MIIHIQYKNGNSETMVNVDEVHYGYNCMTVTRIDESKEEIRFDEISIFKVVSG